MIKMLPDTASEGDVELHLVMPLLTSSEFLGLHPDDIKSKEFLPGRDIGKGAKKQKGYVPDFCVYVSSIPSLVVEAKSPGTSALVGYHEAAMYAHEINKAYPPSINPCCLILATNGKEICAGSWDSDPLISASIDQVMVGSEIYQSLRNMMSSAVLEELAHSTNEKLRGKAFKRPFNRGSSGETMINSKLEPNTFAADLSPILRRYFSSRDQNKDPEIYTKAYISSNEVTSYDRNLESFLKDRLARSNSRVQIKTSKKAANEVSNRLTDFDRSISHSGELQLVTGGVGAGKSLFARRYKEYLQPEELRERNHWSFIDFNNAPDDLSKANEWVCEAFVKSLLEEGAPIDLSNAADQERVFASDLDDRQAYYQRMEQVGERRGALEKARDIEAWRLDYERLSVGLSRYLQGDRGENLIVVFDNVDRRNSTNQLAAFQTALWFMDQTRALVILQMRDVTFELYKDEPPLDTYRTGQIFHISPPRFVDVVKKRLELSLNALADQAPENVKYNTPSGLAITYPKSRAGEFLKSIYLDVFDRPKNISRVLEALAGRNVRKALDMFMAIITSGHMPEDLITLVATGNQTRSLPEHQIIRTLMRQDYRFFSDRSGFISNIFYCDQNWVRPNNLIIGEILFYLIGKRKVQGDNGQMGFISVDRIQDYLVNMGFVRSDVISAAQFLLQKELVEADSLAISELKNADCIKATASGWAHMRLLSARVEYVAAVLPTTPIDDDALGARVFNEMQTELGRGHLYLHQTVRLVEGFSKYLSDQLKYMRSHPGYADMKKCGAKYLLEKMEEGIAFARRENSREVTQIDWLD